MCHLRYAPLGVKPLRILYVGSFRDPWRTEPQLAYALRSLGHRVFTQQEDDSFWARFHHVVGRQKIDAVILTSSASRAPNSQAAKRKAFQVAEDNGVVTIAYHLDRFWDLARETAITEEPWFQADIVFTADGGNDQRFLEAGVNHRWLPAACHEPDTRYEGTYNEEYHAQVAFVGSHHSYHSEWPWRQEMIEGLTKHYRGHFRCFPEHPCHPIRGSRLTDLYASVDVVVGDSCFAGEPKGDYYFSDRPFETLGRGGFLVFPTVKGLDTFFTKSQHLALYNAGNLDQLISIIDSYLSDPDARHLIQSQGRQHVRDNHTYHHRAEVIVTAIREWRGK